ncbi:13808_t:CDS:2, partial [Racocetra persica]
SKAETYYMVLQFANKGNLRCYLRDHFSELDWITKIRMAKEISSGINCLHNANIVHRDHINDPATALKLKQEIASLREQLAKAKSGVNNVTPSSHRSTEGESLMSAGITTLKPPSKRRPRRHSSFQSWSPNEIMRLVDDEALDDEIINRLIRSSKIPFPSLGLSEKEILFPARIISLVAKQMWKYGFIKESERLFANVMKTIQDHVMDFEGDDSILPGAY